MNNETSLSQPTHVLEEQQKLESLLNIKLPSLESQQSNGNSCFSSDGAEASANVDQHKGETTQAPAEASSSNEKSSSSEARCLSAFELRAQSDEFLEITEEEFASVSEFTRGRVKLHEVNQVR